MLTSQRSVCIADATFAIITWDTAHKSRRILGIHNRPSFHIYSAECTLSFEDGADIETVSI
jgi:hypothetical protein